jgi:16S rRNA (guanine527-N7)-methyltransferase
LGAIRLAISGDARRTIDGHVRLLLAWNAAINLTAIRDPAEIAIRHVVDSLTAIRILEGHRPRRIVDLGSGGGFPGIPLVAVQPFTRGILVESVAKKARFLSTVVAATGLADIVEVEPVRAETLTAGAVGHAETVVARAVAPLAELIELAFPLLPQGGSLVAWKGAGALANGEASELAAARRAIAAIDPAATLEIEPTVPADSALAADERAAVASLVDHRLIVVTRHADELGPAWPRDPAARKRKPW